MLRSAKTLTGYKIRAVDGEIGKVDDFYFHDRSWAVRYVVVDTGGWLTGRKVLLAPAALGDADDEEKTLGVGKNREQIRNSPPIDTDMPVSRRYEIELQQYYGWPAYWTAGGGEFSAFAPVPADPAAAGAALARQPGDPDLHSATDVAGYAAEAVDGEIGHVEDLIIDDEDWVIRYLLVDVKKWWPGKDVIVGTEWVRGISWEKHAISIGLNRDAIRNSPEYDASRPMNREYERKLYEYYEQVRKG